MTTCPLPILNRALNCIFCSVPNLLYTLAYLLEKIYIIIKRIVTNDENDIPLPLRTKSQISAMETTESSGPRECKSQNRVSLLFWYGRNCSLRFCRYQKSQPRILHLIFWKLTLAYWSPTTHIVHSASWDCHFLHSILSKNFILARKPMPISDRLPYQSDLSPSSVSMISKQ
jgi:hypothetical protein